MVFAQLLDLYRTDNLPLLLRPLVAAYGFSAGASLRKAVAIPSLSGQVWLQQQRVA